MAEYSFIDKCLSVTGGMPLHVTAQQIIDKVCLAYHLDVSELKMKSQQRSASEARYEGLKSKLWRAKKK